MRAPPEIARLTPEQGAERERKLNAIRKALADVARAEGRLHGATIQDWLLDQSPIRVDPEAFIRECVILGYLKQGSFMPKQYQELARRCSPYGALNDSPLLFWYSYGENQRP